jgi:hypothetical protein
VEGAQNFYHSKRTIFNVPCGNVFPITQLDAKGLLLLNYNLYSLSFCGRPTSFFGSGCCHVNAVGQLQNLLGHKTILVLKDTDET